MKKLMGISVIAALAVLPMAANAARTVQTGGEAGAGSATALASQSYVNGAYNAMNTKVDAVITDSAVAAKQGEGSYAAIVAGNSVSENLVALDEAVATLSSGTDTKTGDLTNLTTTDKTNLVAAINEVDANTDTNTTAIGTIGSLAGDAAGQTNLVGAINAVDTALDGRLDTLEGAVGTENSVLYKIKNNAASADYDNEDSEMNATTIQGAIDELDTRLDTVTSNAGALSADGNYIFQTNTVSQNLSALDTQLKTDTDAIAAINAKQIPIVTDWADQSTVTYTTVASLTGIDCTVAANQSNAACQ